MTEIEVFCSKCQKWVGDVEVSDIDDEVVRCPICSNPLIKVIV